MRCAVFQIIASSATFSMVPDGTDSSIAEIQLNICGPVRYLWMPAGLRRKGGGDVITSLDFCFRN
jgi:hypothetical protein